MRLGFTAARSWLDSGTADRSVSTRLRVLASFDPPFVWQRVEDGLTEWKRPMVVLKWLSANRNGSQFGNINVRRASGCLRSPGIRCYLWQGWFKCRETCSWDRIGGWRTSLQRMVAFLVKISCFACGKQRRSIAGGDLTGETQKRRGREGSRVEEVEGVSQWFLLWPGSSSRPRKSAL